MKLVGIFFKCNFQFAGYFIKFPALFKKCRKMTSVVTLTFDPRSCNIDKVTPRYDITIPPQNKFNPTNGRGGVRGQTHIHTHTNRRLTSIII